jgi:EAL domain-containing protein (putative c-di-GMP-specific phosphodiesterase class I)
LRRKGVRIALDDFGVGQSSLSYVARLPVDIIKIDRTFVAGMGRDRAADAIVAAVMALADRLELAVVAEGVETADQVRLLGRHPGCEIQGYYCSRPRPPDELAPLLRGRFAWQVDDDDGDAVEIATDDVPGEVVLSA